MIMILQLREHSGSLVCRVENLWISEETHSMQVVFNITVETTPALWDSQIWETATQLGTSSDLWQTNQAGASLVYQELRCLSQVTFLLKTVDR